MMHIRLSCAVALLLSLVSPTHLFCDNLEQPAAELDLSAVSATLSLDELQFMANFCLMNYQYILVDRSLVAAHYQFLKTVHEVHDYAIHTPSSNAPIMAIDRAYRDYVTLLQTRQLWQRRYGVYKQELDKQHSAALDAAINTLFIYANARIDKYIRSINAQLDVKLGAVAEVLTESSQQFTALAGSYKNLTENKFPFDVQEYELYYTKVAYIEQLAQKHLQQAYRVYETNDFLIKELDRAKHEFCELFLGWYSALYAYLADQTDDQAFFTFLFNEEYPPQGTEIRYIPAPPTPASGSN